LFESEDGEGKRLMSSPCQNSTEVKVPLFGAVLTVHESGLKSKTEDGQEWFQSTKEIVSFFLLQIKFEKACFRVSNAIP
jgi:hypothetical protein